LLWNRLTTVLRLGRCTSIYRLALVILTREHTGLKSGQTYRNGGQTGTRSVEQRRWPSDRTVLSALIFIKIPDSLRYVFFNGPKKCDIERTETMWWVRWDGDNNCAVLLTQLVWCHYYVAVTTVKHKK
jgi:hypothetical protein